MLPVACMCGGWTMMCQYCKGSGWVQLGRINKEGGNK